MCLIYADKHVHMRIIYRIKSQHINNEVLSIK